MLREAPAPCYERPRVLRRHLCSMDVENARAVPYACDDQCLSERHDGAWRVCVCVCACVCAHVSLMRAQHGESNGPSLCMITL